MAMSTIHDPLTPAADRAIRSAQRSVGAALDSLADSASAVRDGAMPIVDRTADQTSLLAHRGIDAVRDASQQVRLRARLASEGTLDYIRTEPLRAALIAAATGAALMGLLWLFSRPRLDR